MKAKNIITMAALLGTTCAQAGVLPTYDAALNLASKTSWAKQAADMVTQIKNTEAQLASARATFDSLNGARGIAGLLQNPALYNYLPSDVATAMRANGAGMAEAAAIKANLKLFGIEQTSLDPAGQTAKSFTARQDANANIQLLNEQGFKAAGDRIRQIDALTRSIDGATDPMAVNALQVRVAAEQANIANEQARLDLLASMAANAERVREQQAREIVMQSTRSSVMPAGW